MKKKEYFSPKSTLVVIDSSVLQEGEGGYIPGGGSGGATPDTGAGKGMSDWVEPEYEDDSGFGW